MVRTEGHYHMHFGSAVLPWALYFCGPVHPGRKGRPGPWLGTGAAWAITVLLHRYFGWVWLITWAVLVWACRWMALPEIYPV